MFKYIHQSEVSANTSSNIHRAEITPQQASINSKAHKITQNINHPNLFSLQKASHQLASMPTASPR
jgi:hypothetical protein